MYRSDAAQGYNDFFIDIGGNLGSIALPVAERFQRIDILEPNPLIFKLLEVNASMSLVSERIQLHNYGLSAAPDGQAQRAQLLIPKHNWGGAFIAEQSHYDSALLAEKDGFSEFNLLNYRVADIELRDSADFFDAIFNEYQQQGLRTGVIKIDVEGMEWQVLAGLAQTLPIGMKVALIFESWQSADNQKSFSSLFPGASCFQLTREPVLNGSQSKWEKLKRLVGHVRHNGWHYTFSLQAVSDDSHIERHTDFVLFWERT